MIPQKVQNILAELNRHGEAYLVGGCVRDIFLDIEPKDYDIATSLRPDMVLQIFPRGKYVGESFGVVLVDDIEIATFRKDIYKEKSIEQPNVEFVSLLEDDLSRRDFTINAMAIDINGNLIDPFNGRYDLEHKYIKFVGDADKRIEEDPVRMVRACRFLGLIGGECDTSIQYNIFKNATKIQRVANERLRIEIIKILRLQDINKAIQMLTRTKLLDYIFPILANTVTCNQNRYHKETVYEHCLLSANSISSKYPYLRLAMLLHDVGKPATKVYNAEEKDYHFYRHDEVSEKLVRENLTALKFSTKEIEYVCELVKYHMIQLGGDIKKSRLRRFMGKIKVQIEDLIRVRLADIRGNLAKSNSSLREFVGLVKKIKQIRTEEDALKVKDLAVSGTDLIAYGLKPSPLFGQILRECLELVIDEKLENTRDDLMSYVCGKYSMEK